MWYTDVECYVRFEVADAPPEGLCLFSLKSRTNSVTKSRFRTLILQGYMCVEKKKNPASTGEKRNYAMITMKIFDRLMPVSG